MGWLSDQIEQRKIEDNQKFSDSFLRMADAITGKASSKSNFALVQECLEQILKFYHCNIDIKIPENILKFEAKLDYVCLKASLTYRTVKLTKGWYKDATGAFLGFKKDSDVPIALIPCIGGYKYLENGKYCKITRKTAALFADEALCFYSTFPNKELKLIDLVKYAFGCIPKRHFVAIAVMMLVSTLIGLLIPKLTYFLYGPAVEYKDTTLLFSTLIFFGCVTISQVFFTTFNSMYSSIISTNISVSVQAATMMRVFSLKPSIFRKYSAGEFTARTNHITTLTSSLFNLIFNTTLSSLYSFVYIGSIFEFAPSLVVPALIVILVTIVFSVVTTFVQMKISRKSMELNAKESGLSYAIVNGIQKIRLAGAEKRFFARWANLYADGARLTYSPPRYIKYNVVFTTLISLIGTLVMYLFSIKSNINVAEYSAFVSAYGMVFGAFSSLASIAISIASIKPTYQLAKPILEAEPEVKDSKEMVTHLSGNIDISNVSFRYSDSMPLIFDNLSIKINSGQYVAIVGKTGCGKSTLVRLLLGFETPQKGSIYYDGKDIQSLNLKSLRKNIGTVMQDGKLFSGDLFTNIAVCAPNLTLKEAFEAADLAGIGNDIREMPMGMSTMVSDGGGGISGGQKQRLLIARAVAPKPKVLIFDEATSALDNITQKNVSDALGKLKCTRIVIAHRLSTIKQCDRIIFLEDGKIKEEGSYNDLLKKNGAFADLVKLQLLEENE